MKKYLLSFLVIIAFAFYVVLNKKTDAGVALNGDGLGTGNTTSTGSGTGTPTGSSGGTNPPSTTGGGTTTPTPTSTPTTPAGQYKNGTYTGTVADAFYGRLQVTATISGGKLTDVKFPVYPNSAGETTEVSNRSLPLLKQEAITSQSAQVDVVSGATQTSEAFQQTLASALAKAKN